MIVFPNAKINIGLNIINKRPDGYHNLETIFYPVMIRDVLEVIETERLVFTHSGLPISGDSDANLCVKAYQLLASDLDIRPVHIHLHKNIPIGAGLGGGSSDAAFLIRLLNEKFELGLTVASMQEYASRLGADCPFFIVNQPVFATGRGDEFKGTSLDLNSYHLVLIMPAIHISTAEAFAGMHPQVPDTSLAELSKLPVEAWKGIITNDFEPAIFSRHPAIAEIKSALYQAGALYASMSGSGSSIYGIFREPVKLPTLEERCRVFYGI